MGLIHSKTYNPNIFAWASALNGLPLPRTQNISKTTGLNREKKKEIGRSTDEGLVGYKKQSPSVSFSISQLEYGAIDIFKYLANKNVTGLTLSDFSSSAFDYVAYLTDDAGTFLGSKWYHNLRLAGFSIGAGDPEADIERTFDFVGEKDKTLQGNNKYFIWKSKTVASGDLTSADSVVIAVNTPDAVENPDEAGKYMLTVLRDRSGVVSELVDGTDFTYSSVTKNLTVTSCQVDDIIKYAYSATTQGSQVMWTDNDSDPAVISPESAEIYLYIPSVGHPTSADRVYRLQEGSVTVSFDRRDIKEWGNKNVVGRGIRSKTVTISLGRFSISNAIEEILRGAGAGYGLLDVEKFASNIKWVMKIYSDNTKQTFKLGLKATGISPTELAHVMAVDEYKEVTNTLECEALTITTVEADLLDS